MRTFLAILLLAALPAMAQDSLLLDLRGGAAGTTSIIELPAKHVVVKFSSPGDPTSCPYVAPAPVKNEDGTYSRPSFALMTLAVCRTKPREWYEFWTDYPDKGGKFIGEWKKVEK